MIPIDDRRVFRVTVRGQFNELTETARSYLKSSAAEHDLFLSKFTEEGTLSYDDRIEFFNLRYEVKAGGADAEQAAKATAQREAEVFLSTLRIGFKALRVTAMDMSAMWDARP